MTYLGPGVVHLHFAEEIACSYVHYAPVAQSFALDRPYQGDPTCCSAPQQEETGKVASEEDHYGPLHPVTDGASKRRRRKKQKTVSIAHRPREQEARERHTAVEGFLRAAHFTLRRTLHQDRVCAPGVAEQSSNDAHQPSPDPAAEHSGHAEAAAAAEEAEHLDLLGLAELKGVVKPKLQLPGDSTEPATADLFDRVHENMGDEEVVAEAFGVPVLLPACCRFLLSDVKRLQPLVAGTAGRKHPLPRLQRVACAPTHGLHPQARRRGALTAS